MSIYNVNARNAKTPNKTPRDILKRGDIIMTGAGPTLFLGWRKKSINDAWIFHSSGLDSLSLFEDDELQRI